MKKHTLALAILMSLGVAACSSSGDTKYVTDNAAVDAANAKATAAQAAQTTAEQKATAAEQGKATAEAEKAAAEAEAAKAKAKVDAIYAKTNRVSADKSLAYGTTEYDYVDNGNNAALRKALATEESTKALINKIKTTADRTSCTSSAACDRYRSVDDSTRKAGSYDLEAGGFVHNYDNAYAGYAVIREEVYKNTALTGTELRAESNRITDSAINSMFYYVNNPTTDKNAVVNASYTGRANYIIAGEICSRGNSDRLTMNVTDGKISGSLKRENQDLHYIALFNDGEIKEVNGVIGFNGTVTFNPHTTLGTSPGTYVLSSYTGTYQGVFAGSGAEGLAGTFKTDDKQSVGSYQDPRNGQVTTKDPKTVTDTTKIKTIEGVFAAEKQQ